MVFIIYYLYVYCNIYICYVLYIRIYVILYLYHIYYVVNNRVFCVRVLLLISEISRLMRFLRIAHVRNDELFFDFEFSSLATIRHVFCAITRARCRHWVALLKLVLFSTLARSPR